MKLAHVEIRCCGQINGSVFDEKGVETGSYDGRGFDRNQVEASEVQAGLQSHASLPFGESGYRSIQEIQSGTKASDRRAKT